MKGLLRLAEVRAQDFEFALEHGANGILDDVLNDVVGRVIAAAGLALSIVAFQDRLARFLICRTAFLLALPRALASGMYSPKPVLASLTAKSSSARCSLNSNRPS